MPKKSDGIFTLYGFEEQTRTAIRLTAEKAWAIANIPLKNGGIQPTKINIHTELKNFVLSGKETNYFAKQKQKSHKLGICMIASFVNCSFNQCKYFIGGYNLNVNTAQELFNKEFGITDIENAEKPLKKTSEMMDKSQVVENSSNIQLYDLAYQFKQANDKKSKAESILTAIRDKIKAESENGQVFLIDGKYYIVLKGELQGRTIVSKENEAKLKAKGLYPLYTTMGEPKVDIKVEDGTKKVSSKEEIEKIKSKSVTDLIKTYNYLYNSSKDLGKETDKYKYKLLAVCKEGQTKVEDLNGNILYITKTTTPAKEKLDTKKLSEDPNMREYFTKAANSVYLAIEEV